MAINEPTSRHTWGTQLGCDHPVHVIIVDKAIRHTSERVIFTLFVCVLMHLILEMRECIELAGTDSGRFKGPPPPAVGLGEHG